MRRATAMAAVALVGLAVAVGPAASSPAVPSEPGPSVVAGGADLMSIAVGDHGVSVLAFGADPATVLVAPEGGSPVVGQVPQDSRYRFLGGQGQPVWALAQLPGSVIDTTRVPAGPVVVDLLAVSGPGAFSAFTLTGTGEPIRQFGSDGPRQLELAAGRRTGTVWTFGAPGDYRLTMRVTVKGHSHTVTYQVAVAPVADPPGRAVPAAELAQAGTQAQAGRKVFAEGHVDLGPRFVDGTWTVQLRDDSLSPPQWRSLADSVIHVVDTAKIAVPGGAEYAFLGAPGSQVWLLPQAQRADIVWPGWNTQDPSVISGVSGNVTWTLRGITGPGKFALFLTGAFGQPEVLLDTAGSMPQQVRVPVNTHAHGNWAFTAPGIYRLAVEMSATTTSGERVSDARTLNVAVGPVNPQDAFGEPDPGPGGGDDGLSRTGSDVVGHVALGVGLLVAGAALVFAVRRVRRRKEYGA